MEFKVKLAFYCSKKTAKKWSDIYFHEFYFKSKNGKIFGFMYFGKNVWGTLEHLKEYNLFNQTNIIESEEDIWYFIDDKNEIPTAITKKEFNELLKDAELINIVAATKETTKLNFEILEFRLNGIEIEASKNMTISLI